MDDHWFWRNKFMKENSIDIKNLISMDVTFLHDIHILFLLRSYIFPLQTSAFCFWFIWLSQFPSPLSYFSKEWVFQSRWKFRIIAFSYLLLTAETWCYNFGTHYLHVQISHQNHSYCFLIHIHFSGIFFTVISWLIPHNSSLFLQLDELLKSFGSKNSCYLQCLLFHSEITSPIQKHVYYSLFPLHKCTIIFCKCQWHFLLFK
jgi:hypothetical protein